MWTPEIIVLGGGISNKFDVFHPFLIENLKKQNFFDLPEIKKSELMDDAGLIGGLLLIKQELKL